MTPTTTPPTMPLPPPASDHKARVRRRLRVLRYLALVDAILLIALVLSALTGAKNLVHILGPLHGVNFLILLVTAGTAALDGLWGWWFPALILVTAGPIGTLIGERAIVRRGAALIPGGESTVTVTDDLARAARAARASGAGGRGNE